jgi:hypothetical protein
VTDGAVAGQGRARAGGRRCISSTSHSYKKVAFDIMPYAISTRRSRLIALENMILDWLVERGFNWGKRTLIFRCLHRRQPVFDLARPLRRVILSAGVAMTGAEKCVGLLYAAVQRISATRRVAVSPERCKHFRFVSKASSNVVGGSEVSETQYYGIIGGHYFVGLRLSHTPASSELAFLGWPATVSEWPNVLWE